jgi:ribonuclease D
MITPGGSFRKGKKSSGEKMSNTYSENITPEEIKNLELKWFKGEILVADNLTIYKTAIKRLSGSRVLGFDTETRPSFRKGKKNRVSLIQLSNHSLACLFRINIIGIPDELAGILGNPAIIKSGVALHDDIKCLRVVRKFEPAGFVDLQSYVKGFGIQSSGLKKLSAIILGFRISKSQQVTDWEAQVLTEAQKVYAATDAWVCYEIYSKLTGRI